MELGLGVARFGRNVEAAGCEHTHTTKYQSEAKCGKLPVYKSSADSPFLVRVCAFEWKYVETKLLLAVLFR